MQFGIKYTKQIVVFFLFLTASFKAQTNFYSISGFAKSSDQKLIESGNVMALNPKDSSLLKGDIFMDGSFKLIGVMDSIVLLKISAIGYQSLFHLVHKKTEDTLIRLGVFVLNEGKTLNEVEITAKKPLFENDGEKIKVNVENTILDGSGTAIDVLRRSPGVIVTGDDNVSIFGKGNPIIYVDGQLISSNDILKSIPSSEIKNIEIIRNPSARYDASGRAVINIVTKRIALQGYNGNLINNFAFKKVNGNYSSLRLSGSVNKISMNARYGTFNGYDWDSETYDRSYKANDTTAINMHNYIYTKYQFLSTHYYSGGIDYKMDSVTTISAAYNGFYNLGRNVVANENTISENSIISSELSTATETKPLRINNTGNLSVLRKLDTLGSELFFASQYGQFNTNSISEITQVLENNQIYNQQQKRNKNESNIKLITAQFDYTKHFNKKVQLDIGVKESFVKREGELNLQNLSNGVWLTDDRYFSGFDFSENIIAGYAEARYNSGKINLRAGLRAEHTDTYGFSRTLDSVVADRNYLNFFPSAFIGYNFTNEITLGLNYSSRIHRPSYQDMDPFINYIDSLSSIRGNPFLKPEYTTSMEANLVYNKEVTLLTFGYTRTNGTIKVVVDKLNDGSSGFAGINKNLNYSEMFSVGTTLPYENKWFTTGTYIGYNWNTFNYNSGGEVVTNTKPMLYIYMYNEFRFKNSFNIEMEGEYVGSGNDGIFNINPSYYLNIGLKKKLFKDNLTVRLIANDVFATYQEWGGSNVPGFEIKFKTLRNMSHYAIMLNYKFGKMTNQAQKSKTVNQDEFNRIKLGK